MAEKRFTEGARLLREFLDETGKSITQFCEDHELERIQVQRVLKGERWQRVTVNFALAIQTATSGRVPCESWAANPPEPADSGSLPTTATRKTGTGDP